VEKRAGTRERRIRWKNRTKEIIETAGGRVKTDR
jgi:hypothetical protein